MEPTTDRGAIPPFIGGGDRLQQRPVLSSVLIAILAGLLLRMARIVEFSDLVDSLLPDH